MIWFKLKGSEIIQTDPIPPAASTRGFMSFLLSELFPRMLFSSLPIMAWCVASIREVWVE